MSKEIRWGILGPGNIAHSFAKDLALVQTGRLVAVGSRNLSRARKFADEYSAEHAFGSYEELLSFKEVDVIYIATPHTGHMEWAIKAMEHGKHVLCEKPLGLNVAQVQRIVDTAKAQKVFLMEALWTRFIPSIQKIKELVDNGGIGKLGHLRADFSFYALDRDENGRLLNTKLGGGSLLDIGIYSIFLAYLILGKPDRILATSRKYKTDVEIQTAMIFEYPNAQALLYSGLVSTLENTAEISGDKGTIILEPRWHQGQGFETLINSEVVRYELPTTGKGYLYEIEEVHYCLGKKLLESALWTHQNSLDLVGLMDEVRRQGNIDFPFEK